MAFSLIFLLSKEGNPNLQSVAVAKEKHAILTKTSSTQAAKSHAGKAESITQGALNKTMLPMRKKEKKNLTVSHTQHSAQQ